MREEGREREGSIEEERSEMKARKRVEVSEEGSRERTYTKGAGGSSSIDDCNQYKQQ